MSAVSEKRIRDVPSGTVGGRTGSIKAMPLQQLCAQHGVGTGADNQWDDMACAGASVPLGL